MKRQLVTACIEGNMLKGKLRVGLLLNDNIIEAWSYKMIEIIMRANYADICLVIINDHPRIELNNTIWSKIRNNYGRFSTLTVRKILELLYVKLIERNTYLPDAFEEIDSSTLLENIPILRVMPIRKKSSDYFQDEDIEKIKEFNVNILIRCGFGILRGEILNTPKYGVWSFHHGDNSLNRGGPPGFWESMESWPETGSMLQIITEDLDNGKVLYRSYSRTDQFSLQDNMNNYYWKSLRFVPRVMEYLYTRGEEKYFDNIEHGNRHPMFYSERLYISATNKELAILTYRKVKEKIKQLYHSKYYLDQWILQYHIKDEFSSSLWKYKKIIPPSDRFWADPHVIYKNNKYYIYIEEFIYKTQKAHIALIVMDENGNYKEPEIVLNRPYHISYPYVFEFENDIYMVPESIENMTIELYKCVDFPNKWEFQSNLMDNVRAVDTTLLHYKDKWWMFTNMVEQDGGSTDDELFLFSSDELFNGNWEPHPLNPIVSDCKTARPAGKIFRENGVLYRPSQNCSVRYGYGFNINRITMLDENNYIEELVSTVKPNWDKNLIGTHTFNRVNSLHIIDAMYSRHV